QYEPETWAEELVQPAKAADHRRLAQIYLMAAQCYAAGRTDDAVGYYEAGHTAHVCGRYDDVPYDEDALFAGIYLWVGRPERWAEVCRETIAHRPGCRVSTRACLALALLNSGAGDEAVAACDGLLAAVGTTSNAWEKVLGLMGYGMVRWSVNGTVPLDAEDAAKASDVLSQALKIAQDSGNRQLETHTVAGLAVFVGAHGNPVD